SGDPLASHPETGRNSFEIAETSRRARRYRCHVNTIPTEYRLEGDGTSIQSLPKISLHDHLDGGLRPQTLIELADEIGVEVPAADAEGLATWFTDQANAGSLVEYLKTFDLTTAVMQTRTGLQRVAREFVQDLASDGVIYGEIRWAPEQHLARGLSLG